MKTHAGVGVTGRRREHGRIGVPCLSCRVGRVSCVCPAAMEPWELGGEEVESESFPISIRAALPELPLLKRTSGPKPAGGCLSPTKWGGVGNEGRGAKAGQPSR